MSEFDIDFQPVKNLTEEEIENDILLKKLKHQRNLKQEEINKKRKLNLDYFKRFRLFNNEVKKRKLNEGDEEVTDLNKQKQVRNEHNVQENDTTVIGTSNLPLEEKELSTERDALNQVGMDNNKALNEPEVIIEEVEEIEEVKSKGKNVSEMEQVVPEEKRQSKINEVVDDDDEEQEDIMLHESPNPTQKQSKQLSVLESVSIPKSDNLESDHDINFIKTTIKRQFLNPNINFPQYQELFNLMQSTVRDNEGSSTLLIGPKSCGKTLLINKCINQLSEDYPEQFIVIRLNSFIHNDDISAIREISTQLNNFFQSHGYDINIETRQLSNTFKQVLKILDSDLGISLVFIIDNLENFTVGNKQILLYNLLELTTSSRSILVVGTSTKFTTRELLEKRVRSRFSQRLIIMNKCNNFDDFAHQCLANCKLGEIELQKLNNKEYGEKWNNQFNVENLKKFKNLSNLLISNFNSVRNIKSFTNSMFLPISLITSSNSFIQDSKIAVTGNNNSKHYLESLIKSLSNLEVLLVISLARIIEKSNLVALNFNLSYLEYTKMINDLNNSSTIMKSSSIVNHSILSNVKITHKVWDSAIMKNCWVNLYKLGILIDYVPNTVERGVSIGNSNKHYMMEDTRMFQIDISLMELNELIQGKYKVLTKL